MEDNKSKKHIGRVFSIVCLFAIIIITACACTNAGKTNPYLKSVESFITLNEDGSVDITEKHVVHFDYRSDPWWNYYKDVSNYNEQNSADCEISNVVIKLDGVTLDVETDGKDPDYFSSSDKERYAGTGYVYGRSNYYEVGVYMEEFRQGDRTIELSYTLSNVVIGYADCAGFYYKFVSESNEMYYDKYSATVSFAPVAREDIKVWTHIDTGAAEGVIPEGETVSKVVFTAEKLEEGVYLETRILLSSKEFSVERSNTATKASIEQEEEDWYNEFLREARLISALSIIDIVLTVAVAAITIGLLIYFGGKRKPLELADKPIYVREIPEGWTAGEMAPVYHYYGKYEVGDAMSATILELCRRRFIEIKAGDKKKEAEITVIKRSVDTLAPHEKTVYEMLEKVSGGQPFTMKRFEKVAKANYGVFADYIERFKTQSKNKSKNMNFYPKASDDKYGERMTKFAVLSAILTVVVWFLSMIFIRYMAHFPFVSLSLLASAIAYAVAKKKQKRPLTESGQRIYDRFFGLGKFMTEFSNMKTHELPSLIVWEEYMVYATAMGIADKVAEQLEIAYPEYKQIVAEEGAYRGHPDTFTVLYLMSPRFRASTNMTFVSTVSSVTNAVTTMQRNAKIAAATKTVGGSIGRGGGGGGFRGGGGGFGGGGSHAR